MSDLPPIVNTQAQFAMKKGVNMSERIVLDLLEAIAKRLNGIDINYQGNVRELKVIGKPSLRDDGSYTLMFDVKSPVKELSHVEFTIQKTGWEMCLIDEEASISGKEGA